MLPIINGKALMDCSEDDLSALIDNPDYRENEYLDYKVSFSFLEFQKGDPQREKHIFEFRSDVCSFANANGGYLVYGISDQKGMASAIVGVDIPDGNTDRFELDRKNNLSSIMPKQPSVKFGFLPLNSGKYVVILHIQIDSFAPYLHLQYESNYKIYKRIGNGKSCMGYTELKNMFNHSLSIEKEVRKYREDRIFYFKSMEDTDDYRYSQFMLVHIIPDTFMDSNFNKNFFLLEKKFNISLSQMFASLGCANRSIPNVDGLRFPSYQSEECRVNNDCVVEVFQPLYKVLNIGMKPEKYPFGYFASTYVWDLIAPFVLQYTRVMKNWIESKRVFIGISIVGCKNVATEDDFFRDYSGKIDRDILICSPVIIENIEDESSVANAIKRLQIEYALALGIKNSETLNKLIQEVYQ